MQAVPGSKPVRDALAAGAQVFETASPAELDPDLNELAFYTWGDQGCCLPRGATAATLRGAHPALKVNDVLLFQERCAARRSSPKPTPTAATAGRCA